MSIMWTRLLLILRFTQFIFQFDTATMTTAAPAIANIHSFYSPNILHYDLFMFHVANLLVLFTPTELSILQIFSQWMHSQCRMSNNNDDFGISCVCIHIKIDKQSFLGALTLIMPENGFECSVVALNLIDRCQQYTHLRKTNWNTAKSNGAGVTDYGRTKTWSPVNNTLLTKGASISIDLIEFRFQ